MAIYYCHECGKHVDNDHSPMDDEGTCPDCADLKEEENDSSI